MDYVSEKVVAAEQAPTTQLRRPWIPPTCSAYVLQLEAENERLKLNLAMVNQKLAVMDRRYEKALSLLAIAQGPKA